MSYFEKAIKKFNSELLNTVNRDLDAFKDIAKTYNNTFTKFYMFKIIDILNDKFNFSNIKFEENPLINLNSEFVFSANIVIKLNNVYYLFIDLSITSPNSMISINNYFVTLKSYYELYKQNFILEDEFKSRLLLSSNKIISSRDVDALIKKINNIIDNAKTAIINKPKYTIEITPHIFLHSGGDIQYKVIKLYNKDNNLLFDGVYNIAYSRIIQFLSNTARFVRMYEYDKKYPKEVRISNYNVLFKKFNIDKKDCKFVETKTIYD